MKAQSAIEYLTTYGWFLIVSSIVVSVAYSSIDYSCPSSASGFNDGSINVEDFGTLAEFEDLGMVMGNTRPENLKIQNITLKNQSSNVTYLADETIEAGDSGVFRLSGVRSSEACNTVDMEIEYLIESPNSQIERTVSGSLKSNIALEDARPPAQPVDLSAGYSG